jgi:glycerol-3-phosphate dehydrogenase
MLNDGEKLVPGFRRARALRVWTGVRPLFEDARASGTHTREVTRAHALLDHRQRDGVGGFLTITGGKVTTFRLMAQETVDAACGMLGRTVPCTTATHALPGSEQGEHYRLGERLARKEARLRDEQIVCECELVSREQLEQALARDGSSSLDDLRRRLRLGMGPCQGGFCIYRALGIMHHAGQVGAAAADERLRAFLQERWKGVWPILYGDQLRQARLDEWIFHGILNVSALPGGPLAARAGPEVPA